MSSDSEQASRVTTCLLVSDIPSFSASCWCRRKRRNTGTSGDCPDTMTTGQEPCLLWRQPSTSSSQARGSSLCRCKSTVRPVSGHRVSYNKPHRQLMCLSVSRSMVRCKATRPTQQTFARCSTTVSTARQQKTQVQEHAYHTKAHACQIVHAKACIPSTSRLHRAVSDASACQHRIWSGPWQCHVEARRFSTFEVSAGPTLRVDQQQRMRTL